MPPLTESSPSTFYTEKPAFRPIFRPRYPKIPPDSGDSPSDETGVRPYIPGEDPALPSIDLTIACVQAIMTLGRERDLGSSGRRFGLIRGRGAGRGDRRRGRGGEVVSESGRGRSKRSYRPRVEGLESLRLLAGAAALPLGVPVAIDRPRRRSRAAGGRRLGRLGRRAAAEPGRRPDRAVVLGPGRRRRDRLRPGAARPLSRPRRGIAPGSPRSSTTTAPRRSTRRCSRPSAATGSTACWSDIGESGIREVLSRETPEGPDFFRAIDTVKKRAQREKTFQPIDAVEVADDSAAGPGQADWRGGPPRGDRAVAQPPRGRPDPGDHPGRDPRRDRPEVGRRPQDGQQREVARHPEAPRRPRRRPRRRRPTPPRQGRPRPAPAPTGPRPRRPSPPRARPPAPRAPPRPESGPGSGAYRGSYFGPVTRIPGASPCGPSGDSSCVVLAG